MDQFYHGPWRKTITLLVATATSVLLLWDLGGLASSYLFWAQAGMYYMAIFFHELGHTVAYWIFGYPTLPSFDFVHGGGMAWYFERSVIIQWGMVAAGAYGLYYLGRAFGLMLTLIIGLAYLGLVAASLTDFHNVITAYMGHGAEALVGAFLLTRILWDAVPGRPLEFEVHALAAAYLILSPIYLSWGLATDSLARDVYWQQKGSEGFGDFSRIADYFGLVNEIPVAWVCIGLTALIACVPVILWWWRGV